MIHDYNPMRNLPAALLNEDGHKSPNTIKRQFGIAMPKDFNGKWFHSVGAFLADPKRQSGTWVITSDAWSFEPVYVAWNDVSREWINGGIEGRNLSNPTIYVNGLTFKAPAAGLIDRSTLMTMMSLTGDPENYKFEYRVGTSFAEITTHMVQTAHQMHFKATPRDPKIVIADLLSWLAGLNCVRAQLTKEVVGPRTMETFARENWLTDTDFREIQRAGVFWRVNICMDWKSDGHFFFGATPQRTLQQAKDKHTRGELK